MKKYLLFIIVFLMSCVRVFALDIVYPKKNPVIISANSTFFIGSTNPTDKLTINDIEVKVSEKGAFAQMVPLKDGKNEFVIVSNPSPLTPLQQGTNGMNVPPVSTKINFVIEKPVSKTFTKIEPPALLEYPFMIFSTTKDNIPLRTNPVDSGINRMAHLPKGLPLTINGEKNGFYRVYLNSKTAGWIFKSDVEQIGDVQDAYAPVKINDFKIRVGRDFYMLEFNLDKKIPFAVTEEKGLTLKLFNVNAEEKLFCILNQPPKIEDNTLSLNIPQTKIYGYDAYFKENKFILKVRKIPKINPQKPLKNIEIAVDAGHGGTEYGAIGCCGDKEKDINLAIAKNVEHELKSRGADVVMTRKDDTTLSLADRVKIARDNNAMISVSVHANALPDGADPAKNRGTSVFYYHNQAKSLAECILCSMTTQLGTQNDRVRQASLALVRPTNAVSVLIEVAYIINPDDYAMLLDKDFQKKCAKAISDGIENYIVGQ